MAESFGPVELHGDSPDYAVVTACTREPLNFIKPGDVRWLRSPQLGPNRCSCGRYQGDLVDICFTFNDGHEETHALLQCKKCLTIWWLPRATSGNSHRMRYPVD